MKVSYLLLLATLIVLPLSCKSKNKSVEVEVVDWGVVEQEITLDTEPAIQNEDTTIYKFTATTAHQEDAINYFRQNNRLKDWDPAKAKEILVRAVIEKDGSPTRIQVGMYREMDPVTKEMKRLENWKEDDFTREAIRLIEGADITPASNEQGTVVRAEWVNMIYFPPK